MTQRRSMDAAEQLADAYLRFAGHNQIVFEPDGNIPPDFLVDQRIAVEVRRLNQAHHDGERFRGLEEVEVPLSRFVRRTLNSLGPPQDGRSWFVSYSFSRPLPPKRQLGAEIRAALSSFLSEPQAGHTRFKITEGFSLTIFPAGKPHDQMFLLGGYSDNESGGWVLGELETHLKRCIAEKAKKIAPYQARYETWWLLLADHIAYGLDELDRAQFKEGINISHDFDRVVLISPLNASYAFDL